MLQLQIYVYEVKCISYLSSSIVQAYIISYKAVCFRVYELAISHLMSNIHATWPAFITELYGTSQLYAYDFFCAYSFYGYILYQITVDLRDVLTNIDRTASQALAHHITGLRQEKHPDRHEKVW